MASELAKYGLQLPAFSKIGGILASELSVDEAAGRDLVRMWGLRASGPQWLLHASCLQAGPSGCVVCPASVSGKGVGAQVACLQLVWAVPSPPDLVTP